MKVKFTCAKDGEKAQTITVNQLGDGYFTKGAKFRFYFGNGITADGYVNRESKTIYIPAGNFPKGLKRATVGNPVSRTLKKIKPLP